METYLLLLIVKTTVFLHTFISITGIIILVLKPNNRFISNIISKYKPYISIENKVYKLAKGSYDYSNYIPLLSAKY